jgi:hypothetical protein
MAKMTTSVAKAVHLLQQRRDIVDLRRARGDVKVSSPYHLVKLLLEQTHKKLTPEPSVHAAVTGNQSGMERRFGSFAATTQ